LAAQRDLGREGIMSRSMFRTTIFTAVFLGWCGIAAGEEKKEPSAKAKEMAKLLKDNVAKFSLTIIGFFGREHPVVALVTDKELAKKAPKDYIVISEKLAEAVIDALVSVGQFDKEQYISPAGPPSLAWYLYVGLAETPPRGFQWLLGDEKYDLTTNATINELIKILEGHSKKALQDLAKKTAK
jgi:hypothetical protein